MLEDESRESVNRESREEESKQSEREWDEVEDVSLVAKLKHLMSLNPLDPKAFIAGMVPDIGLSADDPVFRGGRYENTNQEPH